MTWRGRLRQLLAVRASHTPGSGSGSMTEGPPGSLHEARPTTNSMYEPEPPRDDLTGGDQHQR